MSRGRTVGEVGAEVSVSSSIFSRALGARCRRWAAALLLAATAGAALAQGAQPDSNPVRLSADERRWLAEHPVIRVATKTEWAPIDLYTYEGQFRGLSGDYLGLIASRLGVRFEYHASATMAESLDALRAGRADLVPSVARTPQRELYLEYTQPYLDVPNVYVARRGVASVGAELPMVGLRIAYERGYSVVLLLRERHPQARLLEFADSGAALRAVSEGQADVYLGALPTTSFLVEKLLLTNLEVRSPSHSNQSALHFGVRKDLWPLRAILDKALASITLAERQEIHRRWVPLHTLLAEPSPPLKLTPAEQRLMLTMPPVRVGYETDYHPYTFRGDDGRLAGMANDWLRLLADKIGLPVGTPQGGTWSEVFGQARRGEVDLLIAIAANEERAREFIFVGPWLSTPNVLITRLDAAPVLGLEQYAGRRIAVLRDGQTAFLLTKLYPQIEPVPVATRDELLAAVANGQADAAFVNATFAAQRLAQGMGAALRMAAFFPALNSDLYFGVRRDQPQLADLLKRALAATNESERAAIAARWAVLPEPRDVGAEARAWLRRLLPLFAVLAVALAVSLAWGVKLQREVARRQRAELALTEARDHAEGLARARQDFLTVASHEIRTPVNAVVGALDQLARHPLPAPAVELAALARQAAHTLSQYVNNLLDLSKSDAGALELVDEPDALGGVLREALRGIEPMARAKGLVLELSIDPRLAALHRFDAFRIHQVVLNLLSNAVRFSDAGRVRLALRVLSDDGRSQELQITVQDEGVGIATADLPRLFSAWSQAGDTLAHRSGGSGLGLALCKRMVDAMGGRITAAPAERRGTVVTVTLRLPVAVHAVEAADEPLAPGAPRLRVLVVEDDRVQQIVLEAALLRAGCTVDMAASAEQAQEVWATQRHAMVLTDLNLPGAQGPEFARWLRAQPGGSAVRLFGTSADLDGAPAARAAGIERVLQKPLAAETVAQLVAAVRNEMRGALEGGAAPGPGAASPV
ncbi:MAG TPA: transporter substrate-binding domain-containing protein [Methylibium sp.]|nr:transporter substrate-binding domain-containing protein [Methylibium sp.]